MIEFTKRQNEIIKTSIELISKGGIQELTIKHIASSIGISEPAIYRHFNSKVDIILAILSYFEDLTGKIAEKVFTDEAPSLNLIENFFQSLISEFVKNPSLTKVIFSEEIFQNDQVLSKKVLSIMHSHQGKILEVIEKGQIKGEIRDDIPKEHIAIVIMGMFRLIVTRWRFTDFSFNLEEKGKEVINSIKIMLRKE